MEKGGRGDFIMAKIKAMRKVNVFIQRVKSGSLKRMFRNVSLVHKESGKSSLRIFLDMAYSMFRYGTGYLDYMTFGFIYIKKKQRLTFMTMNDNLALDQRLNDASYKSYVRDKLVFNERFAEFLHRDYLNLQKASAEEFAAFCAGKESFFAKQTDTFGGLGVRKIRLQADTDLKALYDSLIEGRFYLVEETICQHEEMNRICARSINTLRITTLTGPDGNPQCAYVLMRIGNGKSDVDNVTSGGMYTWVGEDGVLHFPAFCDKQTTYFDRHPVSGTVFEGFRVPYYHESVALCLQAAAKLPQIRYVGWDVAVTPNGPCLVEGNELPGYDMPQNHRFHPDGCGLRPHFSKILQEEI